MILMARPKRNNADYFSHDAGMRDDPKVKALRNKFGITGYAVWCMMLEVLTNADFFTMRIEELEIEILSADFGIDADLFSEILSYMLKLRLLQSVDNCEYLSQKLTERLQPVVDKRRNSRPRRVSDTESTQSKVKEIKEDIKSKPKRFTPPQLHEVSQYCLERNNRVDAQHFLDHYTARGWILNNGKQVKDWKACVRTWEKNNFNRQPQDNNKVINHGIDLSVSFLDDEELEK